MQMLDMDTQERHVLYVSRWLSVDEDDRQIVRELPVHTRTSPGFSLPGTTTAVAADRSHGVLLLHSHHDKLPVSGQGRGHGRPHIGANGVS